MSQIKVKIRKAGAGAAAAVALAVATVAVTASPASATNYNCSTHTNYVYATAMCQSGGGQFKVAMRCKDWWGWWEYREGAWESYSWQQSVATCSPGYFAVDSWVLTR